MIEVRELSVLIKIYVLSNDFSQTFESRLTANGRDIKWLCFHKIYIIAGGEIERLVIVGIFGKPHKLTSQGTNKRLFYMPLCIGRDRACSVSSNDVTHIPIEMQSFSFFITYMAWTSSTSTSKRKGNVLTVEKIRDHVEIR